MNIDIFIPARLESSRLPRKHLEKILDKPSIVTLVNRMKTTNSRKIIVCTTTKPSDDPLIDVLKKENIAYFRGNEKDILQRFLDAAKQFNTDVIIDVEGDDIYTEPDYVNEIIQIFLKTDYDYVSGNVSPDNFATKFGFPHGLVPSGMKISALKKICKLKITNNTETGYREFFTLPNLFQCKFLFPNSQIFIPANLRLTLDYDEDLFLAKEIFKELGTNFHFQDILDLISKKPDLLKITKNIYNIWKKNYQSKKINYTLKQH